MIEMCVHCGEPVDHYPVFTVTGGLLHVYTGSVYCAMIQASGFMTYRKLACLPQIGYE